MSLAPSLDLSNVVERKIISSFFDSFGSLFQFNSMQRLRRRPYHFLILAISFSAIVSLLPWRTSLFSWTSSGWNPSSKDDLKYALCNVSWSSNHLPIRVRSRHRLRPLLYFRPPAYIPASSLSHHTYQCKNSYPIPSAHSPFRTTIPPLNSRRRRRNHHPNPATRPSRDLQPTSNNPLTLPRRPLQAPAMATNSLHQNHLPRR